MKLIRPLAVALTLLFPALVHAHPGHEGDHDFGWDFSRGFLHPLTGWDHLLAMVAVGLWAAHLGGRARWLVPSAFVAAMAAGAAWSRSTLPLAAAEPIIATSLLVLGLLIALAVRVPVMAGMALVAAFAFFHGYAHGTEMHPDQTMLTYGSGFLLTTMVLHLIGLGLGRWGQNHPAWLRASGIFVTICGALALGLR